ncbi:MAG: hypothetical protein AB7N65_31230 [Vicinamibacterales bacterium]
MIEIDAAAARTDSGLRIPAPAYERHSLQLRVEPVRVAPHPFDVETLLGVGWMRVQPPAARPNVLIECPQAEMAALIGRLRTLATEPMQTCVVSSQLTWPADRAVSLLLWDLSALAVSQQIGLYDWMTARAGDVHVIAVTSVPLAPMVERGRFLQALFSRLNVLQARVG